MSIEEAIAFAEDINATVTFSADAKEDEDFFKSIPAMLEELRDLKEQNDNKS